MQITVSPRSSLIRHRLESSSEEPNTTTPSTGCTTTHSMQLARREKRRDSIQHWVRVHPPTISCDGVSLSRTCNLSFSGGCRCLSSSSSLTLLSDTCSFAFTSASWKASNIPWWAACASWRAQHTKGAMAPLQLSADRCKGVGLFGCKVPSRLLLPSTSPTPSSAALRSLNDSGQLLSWCSISWL